MPNVKRTPLRTPSDAGRRPMRPIDREKMRPWLIRQLNSGKVNGIQWIGRDKKQFEIAWRHAARHGWSIEKDACIFELWALHTKKYIEGKDKEKDPKRWKANFRCALNSLPDVERVVGPESRGSNAARRYRFLDENEVKGKAKKVKRSKRRSRDEDDDTDMEEEEQVFQSDSENKEDESDSDTVPSPEPCSSAIPDFAKILSDSEGASTRAHSQIYHLAGCSIVQRQCSPPPSPEPRSISPHSVGGLSDSEVSHYSDEEVVEMVDIWQIESGSLDFYHPRLWNADIDFPDCNELGVASQVDIVTTEEVSSVIELEQHPEYWELTTQSD